MKPPLPLAILVLFFCGAIYSLEAQNLVPNHDFEQYSQCPNGFGEVTTLSWFRPYGHNGTSDYYNSCAQQFVGVPKNVLGYQIDSGGNGYAGIIVHGFDWRGPYWKEYLEVELKESLSPNYMYKVAANVSVANNCRYAIDKFSMYLSKEVLVSTPWSSNANIKVAPQFSSSLPITDTARWVRFSFDYKGTNKERFLTIGNFLEDSLIDWVVINSSARFNYAYAYIDNISVCPYRTCFDDSIICKGDSIKYEVNIENSKYLWQDGSTDSCLTISQEGLY